MDVKKPADQKEQQAQKGIENQMREGLGRGIGEEVSPQVIRAA